MVDRASRPWVFTRNGIKPFSRMRFRRFVVNYPKKCLGGTLTQPNRFIKQRVRGWIESLCPKWHFWRNLVLVFSMPWCLSISIWFPPSAGFPCHTVAWAKMAVTFRPLNRSFNFRNLVSFLQTRVPEDLSRQSLVTQWFQQKCRSRNYNYLDYPSDCKVCHSNHFDPIIQTLWQSRTWVSCLSLKLRFGNIIAILFRGWKWRVEFRIVPPLTS